LAKLSQHENFDQLLLEAIDQGLSGLGGAGKASVYIHLEGLFNIRKQEIPNKLDDFSNALHRIFGLGASQIEILIMKKLYEKVGEIYKLDDPSRSAPDLTFRKYIEQMRLSYKDTEKIGKTEVLIDAGEKQETFEENFK
jgi:hypothetical protein